MVYRIALVLLLLTLGHSPRTVWGQGLDPTPRIESILRQEGLIGVAWVQVSGGNELLVGSAGFRDNQTKQVFSDVTRFHVGSITKLLLATGVLRLATEGRIDLDAPLTDYLADFQFDNHWREDNPVTIRHLLDHTSGLEDARLWQMFSLRPTPDTPLIEALPDHRNGLKVRVRPGSRFSYSNSGYGLLGLLIEGVTGERYEDYLDRNLLVPLEMHDSTFAFSSQEGQALDSRLAWGHIDDGSRYPAAPVFLRPAGQFTTTAGDLGRFALFLMGDGTVDGQAFISPKWMSARGKPAGTEASKAGLIAGYALGLARRDRYGVVGFCHLGNIVGFVAVLCVYPEQGKAFAFSVNTDSETANYDRIAKALVDSLSISPPTPPPVGRGVENLSEWLGLYVFSPNRFDSFLYLDLLFGVHRLSGDSGALQLASLQRGTRILQPTADHLYSAHDRDTTSHALFRSAKGEYLISDGFNTLERASVLFVVALWASLALGLTGVLWILVSGTIVLFRGKKVAFGHPVFPSFLGTLALLLPIPFLIAQPFMALGDATAGTIMLAATTLLLPITILLTLWKLYRLPGPGMIHRLHGFAATAVLQWCVVLATFGMLPLRLWS